MFEKERSVMIPKGSLFCCISTGLLFFLAEKGMSGFFVKTYKRIIAGNLVILLFLSLFLAGCGGNKHTYDPNAGIETITIKDDTGRDITIASEITAIAPSGSTAQMLLQTIAPEMLVGLSSSPTSSQRKYIPESMWYMPTFGQFYGSKSNLNMEALINAKPQIIIDLGDRKATILADMSSIQKQTGIPTVFYEATLETMPDAYRKLGTILGKEEEAEKQARFIERTLEMAAEKSALIPPSEKKTVMYSTGATGLAVNADESSQSQVIDLIGAENAIIPDKITNKGGGTTVSLESVYKVQPDVIIFMAGGPYDDVETNEWSELKAIRSGEYYEIPNLPYCWMSSPPSVNMVLGVWWLGQLVYPDLYNDYDMIEIAQEYYNLFWHYDLSKEEAAEMLSRSLMKD